MEVNTFTNPDLANVSMLARGKLELSSSLQVTFTEVKCMIRMMYVAITRRAKPSRRWYGSTNVSPPPPLLKSTPNATGSNSN